MQTAQHTSGPWFVNGPTIVGGSDACGIPYALAHVLNPYSGAVGSADKVDANARLIAAAPELLEALIECEAMLDEFDANSSRTMRIRSAIAKATGADNA